MAQDAWLRWQGADRPAIADPAAWLVRVATRLCLDRLRADKTAARRLPRPLAARAADRGPRRGSAGARRGGVGGLPAGAGAALAAGAGGVPAARRVRRPTMPTSPRRWTAAKRPAASSPPGPGSTSARRGRGFTVAAGRRRAPGDRLHGGRAPQRPRRPEVAARRGRGDDHRRRRQARRGAAADGRARRRAGVHPRSLLAPGLAGRRAAPAAGAHQRRAWARS